MTVRLPRALAFRPRDGRRMRAFPPCGPARFASDHPGPCFHL